MSKNFVQLFLPILLEKTAFHCFKLFLVFIFLLLIMPNGISAYHLYLNKQLRLIGLNPFPPSQTLHTQLSSGNGDEDDGEDVDGDEVEDNDEYGDEDDDEDGDGDDVEEDEPSSSWNLVFFTFSKLLLANYKH